MHEFEKTTYLAQTRSLRKLAETVLKKYPLKISKIKLIQYGENANFQITDTKNKKYLLKLHRNIYHTKQGLLEEHRWLHHLSNTTSLTVPKPILSVDNHTLTENINDIAPFFNYADIFEWIDGRFVSKSITIKHMKLLGRLMGQLQQHGKKFKIKHRPVWNSDGLVGTTKALLGNIEKLSDISKKDQQKISLARKIIYQKLCSFEKKYPDKMGLIHADLHFGNFLIKKNGVGIIDFDDCGIGFYGYDLIVPIFALEFLIESEKNKDFPRLVDALFDGYSEYQSLTQLDLDMIPYFLCARKLCMLGWFQSRSNHPKLRAKLSMQIKRTIKHTQRDLNIF